MTDAQLNTYFFWANKDFCARTRCIIDQEGTTWTPVELDTHYDLTSKISKFFDVDEMLGGVYYNKKRLTKTTIPELDKINSLWRNNSEGTPKYYFRRGAWIYFDKPINALVSPITVYSVLIPDDFTGDSSVPLNGLTYLEPYEVGLMYYVIWRAKQRISKPEDSAVNLKTYMDYVASSARALAQSKYGPITLQRADMVDANTP